MEKGEAKQQIHDWYMEYSNNIYQYVFFLVGDHAFAKDIVQETFFRAYQKIGQFHGGKAKNWLYKIARNAAMDELRKKRSVPYLLEAFVSLEAKTKTPEQMAVFHESEWELYIALNKLKRSYRDVIVLRKMEGFSTEETAKILGWTENKVKVTLLRGLKALKRELEKGGKSFESI